MEQVNGLQADVMDAKFEELDADQAQEPDPAASFLAREQEQLAGIAAELDYVNEMADTVQLDADHNSYYYLLVIFITPLQTFPIDSQYLTLIDDILETSNAICVL